MRKSVIKSFRERIEPIFKKYAPVMKELVDVDPSVFFSANYWAALKLYCFAAYIHSCYILIISKNRTVQKRIGDKFYFIDLLSGSGINLICNHKDCDPEPTKCSKCSKFNVWSVGSSLLAATAVPPFKKMFFVDDEKKLRILEKRIEILRQKGMCLGPAEFKAGDCNVVMPDILREIKTAGPYNLLTLVDNQGFNADWNTINQLLDCYGDVVITFPTSDVIRNLPIPSSEASIKKFIGCKDISEICGDPLAYYVDKIQKKNKTVVTIPVKTGKPYHYDLIIVTKADAKFSGVIIHIKKSIEANTAREAETAFHILSGKQETLTP
jgi:three-Cys-motif partner protein